MAMTAWFARVVLTVIADTAYFSTIIARPSSMCRMGSWPVCPDFESIRSGLHQLEECGCYLNL